MCCGQGESSAAPICAESASADTLATPFSFVCCRVRSGMFYDAGSFNGDLSKWEVSGATSM